ncbi:MAG: BrnT family toxin [FCB group bacterium]|jgi:uncharacterized DUF497 family protein
MLDFEWDDNKANINIKKHDINFEEAKTVFKDFAAYIFEDEKHSIYEKREIIIGTSIENNLLIVCFTKRIEKIRIISSRLANKIESKIYEENKPKY